MIDVVFIDALRTPIGRLGGVLATCSAVDLGSTVIRTLLQRHSIKADQVDEVILGQVLQAGCGQNPARLATLKSGLSESTPAMTINKVCGSGLKAVQLGVQAIMCGDAEIVVAGGQESMTQAPHLHALRLARSFGHATLEDSALKDGLWCGLEDIHMGTTAENLANQYNISRQAQDSFALQSQQKYQLANKQGYFNNEIVPVTLKNGKVINQDEHPRAETSLESLSRLKPAFGQHGSVTAGNASGINDGAAALLIMSAAKAKQLKLKPMARFKAFAATGVDPKIMGIGPVAATLKCLKKSNWNLHDVDLIEANEAFSSQMLAVASELAIDSDKLNISGGAIAMGHPIGASGARILTTLLHNMQRKKVNKGLATLCIGGGMGVAMTVEVE